MAHDPKREDYQRMALRFALTLDDDPAGAARAMAGFGRRFAQERDTLPQSDADRAFHLVALATELVDYRLPFVADDAQAARLERRARALLDEALSLDAACHDAARMRHALDAPSPEERSAFLTSGLEEVRASCEGAANRARSELTGERASLAGLLAMRPLWRWLSAMAETALICGRNREAARVATELLDADPTDLSDARFTLAYALAKLEDGAGLERLAERYRTMPSMPPADDAWMLLARVTLAYRCFDLGAARSGLVALLRAYPGGAPVLVRQTEVADGLFARVRVAPNSEDELVIAVSEGVVLLQEGSSLTNRGSLGGWVARMASQMDPAAATGTSPAKPQRPGAAGEGGAS